jgi:hypothetical protein
MSRTDWQETGTYDSTATVLTTVATNGSVREQTYAIDGDLLIVPALLPQAPASGPIGTWVGSSSHDHDMGTSELDIRVDGTMTYTSAETHHGTWTYTSSELVTQLADVGTPDEQVYVAWQMLPGLAVGNPLFERLP